MARLRYLFILLIVFISACSTTKFLPAGQKLYTGGQVNIVDKNIKKTDSKALKSELEGLLRPKPNGSILGLRVKLWIYEKTKTNKTKGLRHYINSHFGEPPVLLSSVDLVNNSTILQNRLQNEGYFQAQVSGDSVIKNRTGKAVYAAMPGPGYIIRKVTFPSDRRPVDTAVAGSASESLLKVGDKYNLDMIKNERVRIDAKLKEEGFYYFAPEDLIVRVDSTAKDHRVDLYVAVKNTISGLATNIYTIRNIYVYPNYSIKDTSRKLDSAVKYQWYNVIDPKNTVRPFVFKNSVLLQPGDVYNRTEHNSSLNRFIELGPFKSVNNRFENVSQGDFSKLDVYYFLTQYKRKSLQAEVLARQTSANFSGTQFNLTFRNRNTFKGAELFTLNFFVSNDLQFGHTSNNHSVYQFGVQPGISWPRIIGPFNFSPDNAFIPRTILQTGYTLIDRTGLYRLNSFNASIGYQWKPALHTQHELTLFGVTYVDAANVSKLYRDSILKTRNPALAHVINNQFTFGPSYSYTFTNTTEEFRTNTYYFMSRLSLSGNLYGILTGADTPRRVSKIFNTPFNQYIKIENEARFFHKLGPNNKLATRLIVDVGLPYGNSTVMPYSQQFFIAGANSLRGFQARSIGPGAYNVPDGLRQGTNFLPDESGDIKLEANVEIRPKLFSIVEGALFIDAGNIWLLHPNKYVPGGAFGKNFINQIAADAGVGLRLNLSVLILRGDIGFPIIKPNLPAGQHIVINQIDFGSSKWRGQNLIFNLAIGYPF